MGDFNGNQSEWSDWAFGFKRAIRGADLEEFEIMEKVELANADFGEDELNQFAESGDLSRISGELYGLLCTAVKDEAMTVVRFRGFRAWYKLHMKYNPRTMARAIKLMEQVSSPGQVKNVSRVEAALTKWISKVKMLESQFGENVGGKMKIAIMTSMLPLVIQDFVYQNVRRMGRKSCRHERGVQAHGDWGGWVERLQRERGARGCRWGLVEVQSVRWLSSFTK